MSALAASGTAHSLCVGRPGGPDPMLDAPWARHYVLANLAVDARSPSSHVGTRGAGNREVVMPAREEPTDDVTRRDALKKFGVAAGIAWSAPVVMTFYNAAGAATGSPSPTTTGATTTTPPPPCDGGTCDNGDFPACSTNVDCICVMDAAGAGRCVPGPLFCEPFDTCGPGNSCPPGFFCAVETCCIEPVCVPLSVTGQCPPLGDSFAPRRATPRRAPSGGPTLGSR